MIRSSLSDMTYVAPRTPAEELVAAIYGSLLGVGAVGIYDGFFDLGGDLSLATRLISRLRQIFRINLPMRALFETPNIDGLVNTISEIWGGREIIDEIAWTFIQIEQLPESQVELILERQRLGETDRQ